MENRYHLSFWKCLGANPTPMNFSEVYIGSVSYTHLDRVSGFRGITGIKIARDMQRERKKPQSIQEGIRKSCEKSNGHTEK